MDEYKIKVVDQTNGTVSLSAVLNTTLAVFDALAAESALVGNAIKSYHLMQIVLEGGEYLVVGGEHPTALANYMPDQATLYIATGGASNLLTSGLSLGVGEHNVGTGYRTVLAHEVGHLCMLDVEAASGKIMAQVFDSQPKEYWQNEISGYAGNSSKECFAEAFAAWVHPEYERCGNQIPPEIRSMLEAADIESGIRKGDWGHLEKAKKITANRSNSSVTTADGTVITAAEIDAILDAIGDADWAVLEGVITPDLLRQFKASGYSEIASMGFQSPDDADLLEVLDKEALTFAEDHAADLVTQITESTRNMLRGTISDALEEGWSKPELSTEISGTYAFGEARADMIAHTELAMAHSYGRVDVAKAAGATKKQWLLSADHDPNEDCDCSDAADAGWVDMDDSFTDDDDYDFPPGHPNCWCDWVSDLIDDDEADDSDSSDDDTGKMAKSDYRDGGMDEDQDQQRAAFDLEEDDEETAEQRLKDAQVTARRERKLTRERDAQQQRDYTRDQPRAPQGNDELPTGRGPVGKAAVDTRAHAAATSPHNDLPEPTDGQKHAGNYQKGHLQIGGLDIAIENPAGSQRKPQWPTLKSHYGYIKRTRGADGDHVDCFVKVGTDDSYQGPVYVIDQIRPNGDFDEHKCMIGWVSRRMAIDAYLSNYTPDWKVGPVTKLTWGEFVAWVEFGNTAAPVSPA